MLEGDARIRPANPEDAERLTELAWRSKSYWDYAPEMMNEFGASLTVTQEFLEQNPTYLIENNDFGELLGFYALERDADGQWWLRRHWVVPEYIGTGVGQLLFLHACELAETVGAEKLRILADPNAESFYLHMGAERVGEEKALFGAVEMVLPVLEIKV